MATPAEIATAVSTRDEFLRNYSLPAATAPLVAYDERVPQAPFSPFRRRNASVASRPPAPTQHELDWLEAVTEARAQNNDDAWWWADEEAARHGNDDYYDDYFDDWVDDKADEEAWMKRVEEERIVKELRAFEVEEGDDDGDIARLEAELRMRRDEIARDPQLAAMYLD